MIFLVVSIDGVSVLKVVLVWMVVYNVMIGLYEVMVFFMIVEVLLLILIWMLVSFLGN